ncbi:MAG: hypothetical protein ACREO8_03990 [Luteimonas sp.]
MGRGRSKSRGVHARRLADRAGCENTQARPCDRIARFRPMPEWCDKLAATLVGMRCDCRRSHPLNPMVNPLRLTDTAAMRTEGMNHVVKHLCRWALAAALATLAACAGLNTAAAPSTSLLDLLAIRPSAESVDFVNHKTQFQLHSLVTEQRHPRTWDLGDRVRQDIPGGLERLFAVDEDISARLKTIPGDKLQTLSSAIERALLEQRKIYVYGTGATGRLAKEMESTFWRPFWRAALADTAIAAKLASRLPQVESALIGEMTGADRALISSLEGFEDLQLIGRLQMAGHGIGKGDLVIAVTEGGETSAVIGTVLGAHAQWQQAPDYDPAEARKHLFFLYNNPDDVLLPFDRSRAVIEQDGITKINLTTGPQAVTGSTRMQATTIETWVVAHALQDAVGRVLRGFLTPREMARLGFEDEVSLQQRLAAFPSVLSAVKATIPELAKLTQLESDRYAAGHFSTYFADRGLITVFIDSTERSPTFRLFPLDTVNEPQRKAWIQVWTAAGDVSEAWQKMLGRPFKGLRAEDYRGPFSSQIDDAYLRKAALDSLTRAGDEQQALYDFSFSDASLRRSGPKPGDMGVLIAIDDEAAQLADRTSSFGRFGALFEQRGARLGLILVGGGVEPAWQSAGTPLVHVRVDDSNDPFRVDQQVALKMLLNAHSTAVMARLGKVVGNTMTHVSPSNLKLIGRATYLIQLHVNDVLAGADWVQRHGQREPITYAQANAVLFDTIPYVREKKAAGDQTATEVSLAVVRILESLRLQRNISPDQALALLKAGQLQGYLAAVKANH